MKRKHLVHFTIALSCLLSQVCISQTIKTLSYDAEQLPKLWATPMMLFNNIYPDTSVFSQLPAQEIVLALNEEFIVELAHCSIQEQWNYGVEDSAMKLIQCDSVVTDSVATLTYKFGASEACKGCIVFYNSTFGNERELVIEYTCEPVDSLGLSLTHQDWLIDTTGSASCLLLYLSGQTNASKLKVENYGDGLRSAMTIYPQKNGGFSDTFCIAFSYDPMHQHIPKSNTRIALYGAIGFPKILTLLYNSPTYVSGHGDKQAPERFELHQNYPNPFNPSTIISYQLPMNSHVTLQIYDVLGREVRTLVNKMEQPGSYSVTFNATGLPSGVYFYRLQAGDLSETKRLVLLR